MGKNVLLSVVPFNFSEAEKPRVLLLQKVRAADIYLGFSGLVGFFGSAAEGLEYSGSSFFMSRLLLIKRRDNQN